MFDYQNKFNFDKVNIFKSYKDVLGFDDRWFMLIGIPVVALIMAALMFGDYMITEPSFFWNNCLVESAVYVSIFWIVYRTSFVLFRIKYPKIDQARKRIILQIIGVFIIYFILKSILDPIMEQEAHEKIGNILRHKIGMTISSFIITFMILGIYETIGFYALLKKSELEKEQLERENIQSQLEGLKNQVNPHFLFNSLNTLSYIIPENSNTAVKFVQKLSKVYRYILEMRDSKVIELREELDFLQSYTFLLKERFSENLNININIPEENLRDKILPLSLQLLFENAIKHNIISNKKPLTIDVFVEKGQQLVVQNNLQKKRQSYNGTQMGLENIKNRYRFFSDLEVNVFETEEYFTVILPLIKKPTPVLSS